MPPQCSRLFLDSRRATGCRISDILIHLPRGAADDKHEHALRPLPPRQTGTTIPPLAPDPDGSHRRGNHPDSQQRAGSSQYLFVRRHQWKSHHRVPRDTKSWHATRRRRDLHSSTTPSADQSILYQCDSDQTAYPITFAGGSNIWGSSSTKLDSTSFSGTQFNLIGSGGIFSTNIADGAPINATAVFTNSITDLGLNGGSGPRLLASYKLDATGDTISLFADTPLPPSPSSVPAPLPLFGTAAAFSWSRRLRRRISGSP